METPALGEERKGVDATVSGYLVVKIEQFSFFNEVYAQGHHLKISW